MRMHPALVVCLAAGPALAEMTLTPPDFLDGGHLAGGTGPERVRLRGRKDLARAGVVGRAGGGEASS